MADRTTHEHTEAERTELSDWKLRLDIALAAAKCGWFDWDLQTGAIVASKELEALYGLPLGGFAGTYEAWKQLVYPDDLPEVEPAVERALVTGEYLQELRVRWPDGTVRWMLARARVFRDAEGRPVRMIGAQVDITDMKQTRCCIEALAAERGRLLSQAEEAVRARDLFLAVASHELRTPLTPLRLSLQILQREIAKRPDGERLAGRVEVALRQIDRLSHLVENMLDVARSTMGWRVAIEPRAVDVAQLARDVAARFTPEAARARSAITLRLQSPAIAWIDPAQIDLVLASLLSNAVKYGAGKPIEVSVEPGPEVVRVSVRDHGVGVAPEDRERIFGLFTRAVSERRYGGLGLGLYIAKQIVDAHGGRISCTSEPGAGATFEVELPAGAPPASPAEPLGPPHQDV